MIVEKIVDYFFRDRQNYSRSESTYYVTDLTQCPIKREFALKFPELTAQILIQPNVIIGTLLHKGLESILKELGADTEVSGKIQISENSGEIYDVYGRADAIILDGDSKIGIEVKFTTNSQDLPYSHHRTQAEYYNTLFDLEKTVLLYFTPKRIVEYEVTDRKSKDEILRAIKRKDGPIFDWECRYCVFKPICKYARE